MAKYEYVIRSNFTLGELSKMSAEESIKFVEEAYLNDKPHGRLIDADAFKAYLVEACLKHITHPNYAEAKQITEDFCKDIDEQPTVLEANK